MNQRNTLRAVAKMSDREVIDMTRRLDAGLTTVRQEAIRFGVGTETIRRARRGDTFAHLKVNNPELAIIGEPRAIAPQPTEDELNSGLERLMEEQRKIDEKKKPTVNVNDVLDEIQRGGSTAKFMNPLEE